MGTGVERELPRGEVTLLFTDIEGSTKLGHELGDAFGGLLAEHHRVLREIWTAQGGFEVHAEGDAFLVAFPYALDAVRAASAAQEELAAHAWPHGGRVAVRMGMHTGAVQVREGDYWGVDVHYAARLCSAAHGGQVLVSAATQALVPDAPMDGLGEHAVKDFPVPRMLFHLVAAGRRSGDFPPPRTLSVARTNLPSISTMRLVGREEETEEVCAHLRSDARVLTLTGIGGAGKTRLALACGAELLESFADGVFLVTLAPVVAEPEVARAIAAAVGARTGDGVDLERAAIEHLNKRELLLILDNMEHLLGAAALIARLVDAAPGLRVLVTSQAPLRVRAEVTMPLGSLAVPSAGVTDPVALAAIPSVELFVERARAFDPGFELRTDNTREVAEICRRLDGLPLALELAAARIRLGGPGRLLQALERGIDALGRGARDLPERQRGLRAALDWTTSLLGEAERELFAALGVFADAWTIDQLERMFGPDTDVWESTATLLDFSLIRTRGDGRMTLAEPVRVYAGELLDQQGRRDDCSRWHALMLAEEAEAAWGEILLDLRAVIARVIELAEEFAAARRWSAGHEPALHRRLVAALGMPYFFTGHLSALADEISALAATDSGDDPVSVRLLTGQALVLTSRQENAAAAAAAGAAEACGRRIGDDRLALFATFLEAHIASMYLGDAGRARARERLDALSDEPVVQADYRLRSLLDGEVAINRFESGAIDEADEIFAALAADRGRRDFFDVAAWSYWADCALARGYYAAAVERYVETLRRIGGAQLFNSMLQCFLIAHALAGLGRDHEAVELLSAIRAAAQRDGGIELPDDLPHAPIHLMAHARARLGEEAVARAQERGRARDFEDTVAWTFSIASELAADQARAG